MLDAGHDWSTLQMGAVPPARGAPEDEPEAPQRVECPVCRERHLRGTRFCGRCGSLLQGLADPERLLGRLVAGRYRVVELVAIGGMGRVYAADQDMGGVPRRIALKVLLSEYAACPEIVERFLRECATVTRLEHPNTVKFYDYGKTVEGDLFIAMEFVRGQSLADVMFDHGPLAPARVLRIVGQIRGSLEEAHACGFVHRDLKPDNILLSAHAGQPDFVKVLDFGIARGTGAKRITEQGIVIGSPPYMSPEQFSGADVDARSDVYSLGLIAYKALVGRSPFDAQNPAEWATQHVMRAPLPFEVTAAGARVPAGMKRATMRALSKNPAHRPASMAEFHAELGRAAPEPPRAKSRASVVPSGPGPVTVRRSRYRRACGVIVALACGVLALGVGRRLADAGRAAPLVPAPPEAHPASSAAAPAPPTAQAEPTVAPSPIVPDAVETATPAPSAAPSTSSSAPPAARSVSTTTACEASMRAAWVDDCTASRRYLAACRPEQAAFDQAQSTFDANCAR